MAVRSNSIRYGRSTSSRKNRSSPASFTASVQSVGIASAVSWCTIAPGPNSATAALTGSKVSPTNPPLHAVRRAQAIDSGVLPALVAPIGGPLSGVHAGAVDGPAQRPALGTDLALQHRQPLQQRLGPRRTTRHVDVDGQEFVYALDHAVDVVHAPGIGARSHRDDPLRLQHLVIESQTN